MEASAEPCVAGESPWAASSTKLLLLPGAIQSPALCHHPPLPHRYPSSPLQAFCQPRTGLTPSQRGLPVLTKLTPNAHPGHPPGDGGWVKLQVQFPKVQSGQEGFTVLEEAVSRVTACPGHHIHSLESSILPAAAAPPLHPAGSST